MLSKEQILSAKDLTTETVNVPEWGGEVTVRSMTGTERDSFEQSILEGKKTNMTNIRAKLCARVMVDEQGNRLFTDREIDSLGGKSASALDRVFEVAQRLNGMSSKDIKELEKNSGTGQSGDSTSA